MTIDIVVTSAGADESSDHNDRRPSYGAHAHTDTAA